MSIAFHQRELPELTQKVKIQEVADGSRDSLTAAWKGWMEEASKQIEFNLLFYVWIHFKRT